MKNKYYKRSKISETKFRYLITCFSLDLTATEVAELTGISLRSVTVIFEKLRNKIAIWSEELARIQGTIEVDESYFGP